MLSLYEITKDYDIGNEKVHALRGLSVSFRKNEFVSILGPSGCGKTTLLNIIGGLDQYTSGDLSINGVSTKNYSHRDWDSYRNHSVGFVFQSYNLIPHQSVLANVELALTLSGVSKKERREKAKAVLEKVGLGNQIHKRPNQLSGGQMQRVAIARALINDPSILLADEPTGALDSDTSVHIMDLLKEVAKDRLVIMVTHNPELAQEYSTRIIRLLDGRIVGDTMPYEAREDVVDTRKQKKPSMSFFTALSLSLNNLLTKKARTVLISFAGSIGIIGIALILSLSNGVQLLINRMQTETLSSYPITLEKTSVDFSSMMNMGTALRDDSPREENHIYSVNVMTGMMDSMLTGSKTNHLSEFKEYLESGKSGIPELTTDIAYTYDTPLNIYHIREDGTFVQTNPNHLMTDLGLMNDSSSMMTSSMSLDVWTRLSDNEDLLASQYEVIAGHMPENYNEVVLLVNEENEITDFSLYSMGLIDVKPLQENLMKAAQGEEAVIDTELKSFSYEDILSVEFKLLVNPEIYAKQDNKWEDRSEDQAYMLSLLNNSETIRIVGILRPAENATTAAISGTLGYKSELMTHLLDRVQGSEIVRQQLAEPSIDVFSGLPFSTPGEEKSYTMAELQAYVPTLPEEQQAEVQMYLTQMLGSGMDEDTAATRIMSSMLSSGSNNSYEGNLTKLGVSDPDDPSAILLYPLDFHAKDDISELIETYNAQQQQEEDRLTYTDYIGLMISSITTIINAVSYILIAFVSVSLIVSSIMIGIITYISVLERIREIGVLRAIGASKRDISRVFNAETLTIGFCAGLLGIGTTLLMLIPINAVIEYLTDLSHVAILPATGAIALVVISMFLTFIAGLIPARIASKKDPVIALRSE